MKKISIDAKNSCAVLIGISQYQENSDLENIPSIQNNLNALLRNFTSESIFGEQISKVVSYSTETRDEIIKGLKRYSSECKDTFIFYYAGHGLLGKENEFYFSTSETESKYPEHISIKREVLNDIIKASPAKKKIIIIDSCFAGNRIKDILSNDNQLLKSIPGDLEGTFFIGATIDKPALAQKNGEYTAITELLINIFEKGIIGNEKEVLTFREIFDEIQKSAKKKKIPVPVLYPTNKSKKLIFCYNRWNNPSAHKTLKKTPLSTKIFFDNPELADQIEEAAIGSVIASGITAMAYYRNIDEKLKAEYKSKNPSTKADLNATISLIQRFHQLITPVCQKLDCEVYYFGEETGFKGDMENNLSPAILNQILTGDEFFKTKDNSIRVIIDAIDGTVNYLREIQYFCSAIAIFIENKLRFSAIYDPFHHQVYSASLRGHDDKPEREKKINTWVVNAGIKETVKDIPNYFEKAPVAIHVSRNEKNRMIVEDFLDISTKFMITDKTIDHLKIEKVEESVLNRLKNLVGETIYHNHTELIKSLRKEYNDLDEDQFNRLTRMVQRFSPLDPLSISKFQQIAYEFGGIYALNSGISQMLEVAKGSIGGFVNYRTHPWDVAAGEVMVRASGGIVTDIYDKPIDYTSARPVSVVAGNTNVHPSLVDITKG